MTDAVKILVVEDDMIIGAKISMQLTESGYNVMGIIARGESAIKNIEDEKPDLVLMDINLRGTLDGVQTATIIREKFQVPLIYLTANSDDATFERAKMTKPLAFITKPFKRKELQRAVELAIEQLAEREGSIPEIDENAKEERTFILSDRIFVRLRERMVKIYMSDIQYIEAERSYCKIQTADKEYLLSIPLKNLEEKLVVNHFLRVHRSYLINLYNVDEISDHHVIIAGKAIPVSRSFKEELRRRIQLIK